MTLTAFITSYLYTPIVRSFSKITFGKMMWATAFTMVIAGLWHGAAWTFVAWGAFHAAMLSLEKLTAWPQRLSRLGRAGSVLSWAVVVLMTLVSWVFFRASSLAEAGYILAAMFSPSALVEDPFEVVAGGKVRAMQAGCVLGLSLLWTAYWAGRDTVFKALRLPALTPLLYALAVLAAIYFRGPGSSFVYFQF